VDKDEAARNARALKRQQQKARHRARRHKDNRTVPGAPAQWDLNPSGMYGPVPPRYQTPQPIVRAWDNTSGYGDTVEYVKCTRGCAPGTKCHHGRTRIRTMVSAKTREAHDGKPAANVGPVREDECASERLDPRTHIAAGTRALSWTDMVQHGIVAESQ
jgi:hypothetical protein